MIAALYIDPLGPYPKLDGVDCWDNRYHRGALRDARLYSGPEPVVAHPPCKHWSRLRHLAHVGCSSCSMSAPRRDRVSGGEFVEGGLCPDEYCDGVIVSDRDCALRAVEQARKFGGVLEHPAGSKLWDEIDLPEPCWIGDEEIHAHEDGERHCYDAFGGYSIEIDQCEWGHVARKRTWLYLVGVPRDSLEPPPFHGREPTHYASGGRTSSSRSGGAVPVGIKVCSAQQRRRTPPLLAEYLVRLARAAGEARRAA